jgi:ABC-type cobalt transport system substrate-binding protein
MKKLVRHQINLLAVVTLLLVPLAALAVPLGFSNTTNHNVVNTFLGQIQPSVDVLAPPSGQWVSIVFELQRQSGNASSNALNGVSLVDQGIGINFPGFANWSSNCFVHAPAPVAEPSTMLLLGSGLISLGIFVRKLKK